MFLGKILGGGVRSGGKKLRFLLSGRARHELRHLIALNVTEGKLLDLREPVKPLGWTSLPTRLFLRNKPRNYG